MQRYVDLFNNELVVPSMTLLMRAEWKSPLKMVKKIIRHFHEDSLYRNSIYLMLSTFIMAFFGFFFWIIAARLYKPEEVGIATTLISVMTLLGSLSTLGHNIGLIRFLPKSETKNEIINSSFIITFFASILTALFFLLGLRLFSPKLLFVRSNLLYTLLFVISVVGFSLNTLIESIFTAFRSSEYNLLKTTLFSVIKLILPVILVGLSAYGIFVSVGIAQLVAFVFALILLFRNFKYKIKLLFEIKEFNKICKYSFENYITGLLNGVQNTLFPIMILNKLGESMSAFYYFDILIIGLLNFIPQAISQSLFAEGSNEINMIKKSIIKSIKLNMLVLTPPVIAVIVMGKQILLLFGNQYAHEGTLLLQILAISSLFMSINYTFVTIFRLKHRIAEINKVTFISTIIALFISYFALLSLKLTGVGIGIFLNQIITTILFMYLYIK